MSRDLLTVVTTTIGDSCGHLNRQMVDLRAFTRLPFRQIVSDDGTFDQDQQQRQQLVCKAHGALWTPNPGPTWGISYNWNHAFSLVETPWAFCIEDGLRPSMGWLEAAVELIEKFGNRRWHGHPVGMIGTASFDDWHLALAGILPTTYTPLDFIKRSSAETYSAFWGSATHPNWNDGYWCWNRLFPLMHATCSTEAAKQWPSPCPGHFRDIVLGTPLPPPYGEHANQLGYRPADSWPSRRTAACGWFPGAFMLVNMEAWRKVGRFRDGCTFFEGHLGIRMAQHGYLSLCADFPPWLHYMGMGFVAANTQGRTPRHHEPCDGPGSILEKDFGCNGEGHVDLYNLVYKRFPQDLQNKINVDLAGEQLTLTPGWEKWL